jgi:hypothetical protein
MRRNTRFIVIHYYGMRKSTLCRAIHCHDVDMWALLRAIPLWDMRRRTLLKAMQICDMGRSTLLKPINCYKCLYQCVTRVPKRKPVTVKQYWSLPAYCRNRSIMKRVYCVLFRMSGMTESPHATLPAMSRPRRSADGMRGFSWLQFALGPPPPSGNSKIQQSFRSGSSNGKRVLPDISFC